MRCERFLAQCHLSFSRIGILFVPVLHATYRRMRVLAALVTEHATTWLDFWVEPTITARASWLNLELALNH